MRSFGAYGDTLIACGYEPLTVEAAPSSLPDSSGRAEAAKSVEKTPNNKSKRTLKAGMAMKVETVQRGAKRSAGSMNGGLCITVKSSLPKLEASP